MADRYQRVAVTAAINGGDVLPSQSAAIPRGAEGIVDSAVQAAAAGAACVHLHAREADGRPTGSGKLMAEIVGGIRARCDVVVNVSTGGSIGMKLEERLAGVYAARPDIGTLNLGTMNYESFAGRRPVPDLLAWEREIVESSGQGIFVNTLDTIRRIAAAFKELQITPELEAYDLGHLSMARFLLDEGTLEPPVRVQLVLGVLGGASNSLEDLVLLKDAAMHILGADLQTLGVAATGYPMEFRHAAVALAWGMNCRVGLEDNLRIARDRPAKSNAELVEVTVQLARLVGRPLMSAQQFRESLGPWSRSSSVTLG